MSSRAEYMRAYRKKKAAMQAHWCETCGKTVAHRRAKTCSDACWRVRERARAQQRRSSTEARSKADWSIHDSALGKMPDKVIAELAGVSVQAVAKRRLKLGIPSNQNKGKRSAISPIILLRIKRDGHRAHARHLLKALPDGHALREAYDRAHRRLMATGVDSSLIHVADRMAALVLPKRLQATSTTRH